MGLTQRLRDRAASLVRRARAERSERSETGASAVEFALVLLPLIYLVFGIITYGYMFSFRQAISQAVGEGARAAAIAPAGTTTASRQTLATQQVNTSLKAYGITCTINNTTTGAGSLSDSNSNPVGTCAVAPTTCTGSTTGASCMKVTVDYNYAKYPLTPGLGFGMILPNDLVYNTEVQVG